jgi:phosphoserine phosphatase RsbU/P
MEEFSRFLTPFLQSFLSTKLFFIIILYLFLNYVLKKKNTIQIKIFLLVTIIIFARDLLQSIFIAMAANGYDVIPSTVILIGAISDVMIIIVFQIWLRFYTERTILDIIYYALNFVICVVMIFFTMNITIGFISGLILRFWVLISSIYFFVMIYQISEFNTKEPDFIIGIRTNLTKYYLFINAGYIILVLFGINFMSTNFINFMMHNLILPLTYFIYFYVIFKYDKLISSEEVEKYDFMKANLDSMFSFMSNLGSAFTEKIDMPKILNMIIESAVKNTEAQAGAILLIDSYEDILKVEAVTGNFPPPMPVSPIVRSKLANLQNYFKSIQIRLGETIFGETAKSGVPVYIKNTLEDNRLENNTDINGLMFISSFICIPLIVSKKILGVISIIKREDRKYFNENDYNHIKTFADYASLTIDFIMTYAEVIEKREMEREVGIAADIQQKLTPAKLPVLPEGLAISTYSLPAKGVSGDYYDIINLGNNKIAILVGDVAGKGIPAALVMVMIRSILHLICSPNRDSMATITWLNKGLVGSIDMDHFATLGFFIYDTQTKTVNYTNAAHHPLLVIRSQEKKIFKIDTDGLPLGIEKESKYGQKSFKIRQGDMLMLYTDGIIEAMNGKGEQYTYETLERIILNNSDLMPNEITEKIVSDIKLFVGNAPQHDDQTMLIMKVQ